MAARKKSRSSKSAAVRKPARTAPLPKATAILPKHKIAKFGWVPDLPDARDKMYLAPAIVALPRSVDLRRHCPPIYDQGQLGSCTGNAIAGAIQFDRMKQKMTGAETLVPSRLFIYYNERVIEHSVGTDSGAQIRDGIKTVNKLGACFEGKGADRWPYDISRFTKAPPPACFTAAKKDRVASYSRLRGALDQLKGCLASGYPFVFGFTCYESFESQAVAKSGELNLPLPKESVVGGHAVLAVGYDDGTKRFLVRNSWGKSWGKSGYFTMPYDYLTNNNLADDMWTIRLIG